MQAEQSRRSQSASQPKVQAAVISRDTWERDDEKKGGGKSSLVAEAWATGPWRCERNRSCVLQHAISSLIGSRKRKLWWVGHYIAQYGWPQLRYCFKHTSSAFMSFWFCSIFAHSLFFIMTCSYPYTFSDTLSSLSASFLTLCPLVWSAPGRSATTSAQSIDRVSRGVWTWPSQ